MNIKEYAQEIEDNTKNITDPEYFTLGIFEEYGEVIGKVKRFFRGDYQKDQFREQVKKELGDMLFYLVSYENRIQHLSEFRKPKPSRIKQNLRDLGALNLQIENPQSIYHLGIALRSAVDKVTDLASNFNLTLDEIIQTNLDKIHSRAERGVIKGSGDER